MAYNPFNPAPQTGNGAFGLVPGVLDPISAVFANPATLGAATQVGMPNPFGDLSAIYPNLGKTNNALSALIASELSGELSPQEQAAIQDARARYGVASGMPGAGLNRNATVRDLGLATGLRQQQGLTNYGNIIPTISKTQTVDPALQAQINTRNANAIDNIAAANAAYQNQFNLANQNAQNRTNEFNLLNVAQPNAINAAAPNPEDANNYALKLFNDYLSKIQSGGPPAGSPLRTIQGPGPSGLGPPAGNQNFGNGNFGGPQAPPASGSVISGGNNGSVLGGGNGQGTFGNNWNAGAFDKPQGSYTFGSNAGATNTNANIWDNPWSVLNDGDVTWASGTRDPFQAFETTIPQSGTPNSWGIFDQSPMWT